MTVRNIIKELLEYNLDAEINIVDANGQSHNIVSSDFGYGAGDGEGVSKTNTTSVSIHLEENNEVRNKKEIDTLLIKPMSDVMDLMDFLEYVDDGSFIDDDGFGYLATKTHETNIEIEPSSIHEISKEYPQYKYVTWYNK